MRVLVYEAVVGGHFLNFAGQVAAALAHAGAQTHIAVARNAAGQFGFETYIAPLRDEVTIHPIIDCDTHGSPYLLAWQRLLNLRRAVEQIQPDRLYLSTADGIVQLLGIAKKMGVRLLPSTVHVEALLLNGAVCYPKLQSRLQHFRRRANHRLALAGCNTLHHLNPFVRDWEATTGVVAANRVLTMPDPVEQDELFTRDQARTDLGLPVSARIIGMVGRLDGRKGADVLIDAFMKANTSSRDVLMLWGPCGPDLEPRLRALQAREDLQHRVFIRNKELSEPEFVRAIAAVDLMALPYRLITGSSSIVIRAAAAGRPVITTGGGWAEQMIHRFGLGWTFEGPDPRLLAEQLPELLENASGWHISPEGRRFVEYNTRHNFAAHWTLGYRRATGANESNSMQTWESLLSVG